MKPSSGPLSRLFLVLLLILILTPDLVARPASRASAGSFGGSPPTVYAEWFDFVPVNSRPTRTTVIRITALAMVFALFIMYRTKH